MSFELKMSSQPPLNVFSRSATGSIGMYCLSQRRSWSELGRKPPWAAVPMAASGGGLGRDEAEMEGRERQSLKCVSYTTTGGSTHAHP